LFFYSFDYSNDEEIEIKVRFTYEDISKNKYDQTLKVQSIKDIEKEHQSVLIYNRKWNRSGLKKRRF
jgi:hypothetical protein